MKTKEYIVNFLQRVTNFKYLSSWWVLLFDMLISVLATATSAIALCLLRNHGHMFDNAVPTVYFWRLLTVTAVTSLFAFIVFKTYRKSIRHTTMYDVEMIAMADILKCVPAYFVLFVLWRGFYGPRFLISCCIADLFVTFAALVCFRAVLIFVYDSLRKYFNSVNDVILKRVLIYGTSDKSVSLVTRLKKSTHYKVVGFLEYGRKNSMLKILDLSVYNFVNELDVERVKSSLMLDGILFASVSDARMEESRLVKFALQKRVTVFFSPGIDEVADGNFRRQTIRQIKIEDLLGRDEIKVKMEQISLELTGKTVLVTGAAGSIGSELCRQLARLNVGKLILFDNAETPLHNLRLELTEIFPALDFVPVIGDVRLQQRLDFVFRNYHPQVVFHAAAYKHVPLMEENPCEAVLVNVYGTRNVADKCIEYGVDKMVMISTDKAVNPTNIMGCTKRLAEIYVQSLGIAVEKGVVAGKTSFVTTRFGNVLGSNGSVIPRFRAQIENGGPVTVTHPDINRFFMTIPEACRLVMEAACMGTNNRIFVFDMGQSVKIVDLAKKMISLAGYVPGTDIKIEFTGLRPGEKLYEEVLANSENTDPTAHERIRVARVRDYDYAEAEAYVDRLRALAYDVKIADMIRLMKEIVPEYKSRNSEYEKFDR